jgi:hypothetical protein
MRLRLRECLPLKAAFSRHREDAAHYGGEAVPVGGVFGPLFSAGFGDGVVLRLTVVVGDAPFGCDPAALLQTDQRGIDGALVKKDLVAADHFDTAGYAVTVERAHSGEGLQNHEVEGALE